MRVVSGLSVQEIVRAFLVGESAMEQRISRAKKARCLGWHSLRCARCTGARRRPTSQSLDLLRFLQEALTNVLKHSASRRVDVAVPRAGAELRLSVRDDGCGFVVDKSASARMGQPAMDLSRGEQTR